MEGLGSVSQDREAQDRAHGLQPNRKTHRSLRIAVNPKQAGGFCTSFSRPAL